MSEETNQLYHYTSMNALFEILYGIENDNLKLWATHYQYLNDKSECQLFEEFYNNFRNDTNSKVQKQFNSMSKLGRDEVYIISFSKEKDDLTMFRHYGNGKGGCLTFDLKALKDNKYEPASCKYPVNQAEFNRDITTKFTIIKVPFLIANNTNYVIDYNFRGILNYIIKHQSFKPENEERLIFLSDNPEELKFFEKNGLIKPYVEIKIPVTALKQIWLAPGCDEELSRKSILMLLKSKNITHITESDIIHSKHPYIDR